MHNYDDKELKLEIFKTKLANMSYITDEKLLEQIFGHTLIKLANKVINIILININKNIDKLFEMDDDKWVALYDATNLILD